MTNSKRKPNQGIMYRTYVIAILIVITAVYGTYRLTAGGESIEKATTNQVDQLADCLTASGAKLYGTFWCPHCTEQKKAFGDSFGRISYIECTVDGQKNVMSQECKDAGVTGFPTWIFGDGTRVSGKQSFADLAAHGSCDWKSDETIIEPSS
ncbi:MAG: hypothetical protein V1738_03275 [Patescibacteria group bacterium]